MKRRLKQNVWGNWSGYLGVKKVIEFGTDKLGEAEEWLLKGFVTKEKQPLKLK